MSISKSQKNQLASKAFQRWLDEKVLSFGGVSLSRTDIVELTRTPCVIAAARLGRVCAQFNINSLDRLFHVGIDGLTACAGIGERSALVVAYVLASRGYDVDAWLKTAPRRVSSWQTVVKESQRRRGRLRHTA